MIEWILLVYVAKLSKSVSRMKIVVVNKTTQTNIYKETSKY